MHHQPSRGSIVTELAKGLTLDEVKELGIPDITEEMGEEDRQSRVRCATLALGTLQAALDQFRRDRERRDAGLPPLEVDRSRFPAALDRAGHMESTSWAPPVLPNHGNRPSRRLERWRRTSRLVTVNGIHLEIVHRGTWAKVGPDFRDALILFAGKELRAGSVEIHRRTRLGRARTPP